MPGEPAAHPTGSPATRPASGAGRRRRAFTVALVGGDGAGKTTLARELERMLPLPARYVYMGANPDSAGHVLPTTRLVHGLRRRRRRRWGAGGAEGATPTNSGGRARAVGSSLYRALWLCNRMAEVWYRQAIIWRHLRAGRVVVLDRHYAADYAGQSVSSAPRTAADSLHAFLLTRLYPRPDLIVMLDAPPAVLLARKGEGTLESLRRRRADYLALTQAVPNGAVVDADRPLEVVRDDVLGLVLRFAETGSVAPPPDGG